MFVLPNGFAAGGLTLDPNRPPAGVEVVLFVWPKGLSELALVDPKANVGLGFAGSDMVFERAGVALGLGDLLAVDLRRGILGL